MKKLLSLALLLAACGGRTGFTIDDLPTDAPTAPTDTPAEHPSEKPAVGDRNPPDTLCTGEASEPMLLATGTDGAASIAVYNGTVYVASFYAVNGKVWKIARDTGALELIATSQNGPTSIAADASGAYWTTAEAVVHYRAGGVLETSATSLDHPGEVALGSNGFYVADRSNTGTFPVNTQGRILAFTPHRRDLVNGLGLPTSLALDDQNIYYTDWVNFTVGRVSRSGGDAATLTANVFYPDDIAVEGNLLYFTGYDHGVFRFELPNGPAVQFFSTDIALRDLALDATDVYVGGHDTIDWNSGALYRIPRNGGPLETVNQGHSVFGIAVDVARVYWTRGGAGEVWMRCKGE